MAPNLTNTCDVDVAMVSHVEELGDFAAYNIITWIHFLLGTPGHLLMMIAFYKQRKEDPAYMYQVFVTVSEMLELLTWALLVLTKKFLSGAEYTKGYLWYKRSYFLMYFAAKLAYNLFQVAFTWALLLAVAMAADRVFALAYPFKYRHVNARRHQMTAFVSCLVISVGTSFNDVLVILEEGDHYQIVFSYAASRTLFATFMGMFCNAVRCAGLVILIVLNVLLVRLYHERVAKTTPISGHPQTKEGRRKAQERTLLALTICQSVFQALTVLSTVLYYTVSYFSLYFVQCIRYMYYPFVDMTMDVCDLMQLYVTVMVNGQFRRKIRRLFPCGKVRDGNSDTRGAGLG